MNIVPKEFRKMQEFQHVEIPAPEKLFGRAQGLNPSGMNNDDLADFTSRKIDLLSQTKLQTESDYMAYVEQMNKPSQTVVSSEPTENEL